MREHLLRLLIVLLLFVLLFFNPVMFILVGIIIFLLFKNKEYKSGAYYQVTKYSYLSVRNNTGRYGEYLTYKYLKHMEDNGARFLFNVYIPRGNGETTEIDVLMICSKGIFVFESKNYSGWIFGSESQKYWYQTFPAGRGRSHKVHFYNPVMQNHSHIKHLKSLLREPLPIRSIIVFSNRCTLKHVNIDSSDISVINRYNLESLMSEICNKIPNDILSEENITKLYNKLYPFTQVDEIAKAEHVVNIHNNINRKTIEKKPLKCPRCNGELILRTATKGINAGNQFYGCSNYPKCRYIQNITDKTV